jgi:threonine synthase
MCRASGGTGHCVTDESVWQAQRRLAREEGIFCEPAGAVSLAGIVDAARHGEIDPAARIICLVTGIGFKDPASVEQMAGPADCPMIAPQTLLEWARGKEPDRS